MLRKIPHAILAGALLLGPAPAAMAYKEVCVDQETAGYVARFIITFLHRDNHNGLDTSSRRDEDEPRAVRSFRFHAHEHRCANLQQAGAKPGDRMVFKIFAEGGNTVTCPGPRGLDRTYEGFYLQPDGRPRGRLTFFEKDGTTLHHRCQFKSGTPRMHSACNATFDGMANTGCGHWRPNLTKTVLHEIIANDSGIGMLGSAIQRGADVNRGLQMNEYPDYTTPLHVAVHQNHPHYAEWLLRSGANPSARDVQGRTPVLTAVLFDRPEILKLLLDAGGSPTAASHNGFFPLYIAARKDNVEVARMLLDAGAARSLNQVRQDTGETALEHAKAQNSRNVLKLLRRLGATESVYEGIVFDILDEDRGLTALRKALYDGASADFPGEGGRTALHVLAERNLINYLSDLLRLVRDNRVQIDAQDEQGRTPLLAAVEANAPDITVAKELLKYSQDPNIADANGNFPLYQAVQNGNDKILRHLVFKRGMDLNQRHSGTGLTPLGLAKELVQQDPETYATIVSILERRRATI